MKHAWTVGVEITARSVHHVLSHKFVQLWVSPFVRDLTGHDSIHMFRCSRLVC